MLAILAPRLQSEIGWSELDYGRIVIAFQAAYAGMMAVSGALLDRVGVKLGYALAIVVWSLAAMGHALAGSAAGFGVARFALGLGDDHAILDQLVVNLVDESGQLIEAI